MLCCCSCCCCCACASFAFPPGFQHLPGIPSARLHGITLVTRPSFKGRHSSRLKDKLGGFSGPLSGTHSKAAASLRKTTTSCFVFFFTPRSAGGRSTRCVSSRASVVKSKSRDSWLRRQSPDLFSRPPAMKPAKVSLAEAAQGRVPKCDSVFRRHLHR